MDYVALKQYNGVLLARFEKSGSHGPLLYRNDTNAKSSVSTPLRQMSDDLVARKIVCVKIEVKRKWHMYKYVLKHPFR